MMESLLFAVIPQHNIDSISSSYNEEIKPAAYYERLKILRQRQGLENTRVSTSAVTAFLKGFVLVLGY